MDLKKTHAEALKARKKSYSPYSRYSVGAALLLEDGTIVPGCNVENASFGATICAERTAFFSAVAQLGKFKPEALVLITEPAAVPCGLCLQVMAEFCPKDFPIYLGTPRSLGKKVKLKDLLPHSFGPESLEKKNRA
jgi:cytidine deaminase